MAIPWVSQVFVALGEARGQAAAAAAAARLADRNGCKWNRSRAFRAQTESGTPC